jgi:putative DNA primase/helicase
LSLFGGIQPARLRSYLVDALRDGPANDGLIQRFQVVVWPDIPNTWKLIDRAPDPQAEALATRVFERLANLKPDSPITLKFAGDAQSLFNDWLTDLESRLRSTELHPAMAAHLSKYRKLMPALAVLFEMADWAASGGDMPQSVSLEQTRKAAAFCDDYLESHAERMYSCITTPEIRAARDLAEKLKRRKLPGAFSLRDVYIKGWTGLGTPDEARAALRILADSDWVQELISEPSQFGGRRSEQFQVNPKVYREE